MHQLANKVLSGDVVNGQVVLSFRAGMADLVSIYSRRPGESDFSPIEDEAEGLVIDDRPNLEPGTPEERRYYAILLYSGEENRQKSNEIVLVVPG